jgi:acyl-CoA thioesterase YciA
MMPRDTNYQGTIFGGVILSLIDQAAFVEALRQASHRYVTVAMDRVEFHEPVYNGDIVTIWATARSLGRRSMRVHVDVNSLRRQSGEEIHVTEAEVTLVAVDEQGKPVPIEIGRTRQD